MNCQPSLFQPPPMDLDDAEQDYYATFDERMYAGPHRTTDAAHAVREVLPPWQADERLAGWQSAAATDRGHGVVLSLFDRTGNIVEPWRVAGYDCYSIDTDDDCGAWPIDVMSMGRDFMIDHGLDMVDVVLAQPPCTDFASSGARWFADKDADGRTAASVALVHQTLALIAWLKPIVWALENPIGRIARLTGLPRPRLRFHPHHYGDPYTKRTQLWGEFNANLPQANVEPVEGSRMHKLRGDVPAQKKQRSVTPEGFAWAFYMANRNYRERFMQRLMRGA